MEQASFTVEDRRHRRRVAVRLGAGCDDVPGTTLNLSLRGARILTRGIVDRRFLLRLHHRGTEVQLAAERVWEEPLGGGCRVVGVRFAAGPEQHDRLVDWLLDQAS